MDDKHNIDDKPQKQQVDTSLEGNFFEHAKQNNIDDDLQYGFHLVAIRGTNGNG
ncbi:hypothetical protein [uncultured Shewanella sp.]|uniref:hypothetical protein n=1 Tax=uncultured Shewanella sp. TaxID=173975 RepID=UPI00261ADF84|nr:hypothetical protein [uncultured Shewanella sp.]